MKALIASAALLLTAGLFAPSPVEAASLRGVVEVRNNTDSNAEIYCRMPGKSNFVSIGTVAAKSSANIPFWLPDGGNRILGLQAKSGQVTWEDGSYSPYAVTSSIGPGPNAIPEESANYYFKIR